MIASRGCSPNNKRQSAVFKWNPNIAFCTQAFPLTLLSKLCLYRQINKDSITNVDIFQILKGIFSVVLIFYKKSMPTLFQTNSVFFGIFFITTPDALWGETFLAERYHREQMTVSPSGIELVTFYV